MRLPALESLSFNLVVEFVYSFHLENVAAVKLDTCLWTLKLFILLGLKALGTGSGRENSLKER